MKKLEVGDVVRIKDSVWKTIPNRSYGTVNIAHVHHVYEDGKNLIVRFTNGKDMRTDMKSIGDVTKPSSPAIRKKLIQKYDLGLKPINEAKSTSGNPYGVGSTVMITKALHNKLPEKDYGRSRAFLVDFIRKNGDVVLKKDGKGRSHSGGRIVAKAKDIEAANDTITPAERKQAIKKHNLGHDLTESVALEPEKEEIEHEPPFELGTVIKVNAGYAQRYLDPHTKPTGFVVNLYTSGAVAVKFDNSVDSIYTVWPDDVDEYVPATDSTQEVAESVRKEDWFESALDEDIMHPKVAYTEHLTERYSLTERLTGYIREASRRNKVRVHSFIPHLLEDIKNVNSDFKAKGSYRLKEACDQYAAHFGKDAPYRAKKTFENFMNSFSEKE